MLYLGWVIAAFLGGFLLASLYRRKRPGIAKRFAAIPRYRGLCYAELLETVKIAPQQESRKANGQLARTWSDGSYSITLLFDDADICLGVEDEKMDVQRRDDG